MRRYVGRRDPGQTAAVERHCQSGSSPAVRRRNPRAGLARAQQNIIPVVDRAVREAGIGMSDLDGIAFTRGPGLLGSLLVGVSFAKGLACRSTCR